MTIARFSHLAVSALVCLAAPASASDSPFALPEPAIDGIAIRPFDAATGQFGADIAADDSPVVVNRRIGDAEARDFLIVVVVKGMPRQDLGGKVVKGFVRRLRVELVDPAKPGKPLFAVTKSLGAIPAGGVLRVPVLVEPDGCRPVIVRAALIGGGAALNGGGGAARRERRIDFVCQQ